MLLVSVVNNNNYKIILVVIKLNASVTMVTVSNPSIKITA